MEFQQGNKQYQEAQQAKRFFSIAISMCMENKLAELESHIDSYLESHPNTSAHELFEGFQSEGRTLIHLACSSGNPGILKYLLSKSKNKSMLVNLKDEKGFTPVMNAAIGESIEMMEVCIEKGANVNECNNDGASACHFAAGDGSVERLKLLIKAGADYTLLSRSGTPLHWAAGKGRAEAIKYFIDKNNDAIDINQCSPEGLSPVIMAAVSSSDISVCHLVKAGADVTSVITGNLTLLHICAENNLTRSVSEILKTDAGKASCTIETSFGYKPIEYAAMSNLKEIVEKLYPYSHTRDSSVESLLSDGPRLLQEWNDKNMVKQKDDAETAAKAADVDANGKISFVPSTRELESMEPAATEENRKEAMTWKSKGNETFKQKQFKIAIDLYTKAIQLHGNDETFWGNRSASFLSNNDAPNALLDAEVCRRLKPDWAKGCFRLASARMELGLYEDAAVAAFEGIKLDNNNFALKKICKEAVDKGKEQHKKELSGAK